MFCCIFYVFIAVVGYDAPHPENPRIEHENLHALEDRAHKRAPVDLHMLNHTKGLQERTQDPDDGGRQQSGMLLIRYRQAHCEVQQASEKEGPDDNGDERGRVGLLTREARLRALVHARVGAELALRARHVGPASGAPGGCT